MENKESNKVDYPIEHVNNLFFLFSCIIKKKNINWIEKKHFEMEIKRRDVYYEGKLHKRE